MKKLRSNSKEVREAVRLHLIEISENDDVKIETVYQAIVYIISKFYNEMIKNNNNLRNIQERFIYWLEGLALNTYYYTDDIINYLNSIGLYGKNEQQEQEKAADLYHYLIFREVKDYM
jgi:hypothetical protein